VLGISVDSTHALRAWRREQGYRKRFPSGRWPLGAVAKRCDVWNEQDGQVERGAFILNTAGVQARDEAV
jgi:alkyl hydroperoxide reductase subunit AhpC